MLKDIHDLVVFLKNQGQSGSHNPDEITNAVNMASRDLFNALKEEYERTKSVSELLSPFKETKKLLRVDDFSLPEDFETLTDIESSDGYPVDQLTDNEWSKRKRNPLLLPEIEYPVFRIMKGRLQVLPDDINEVEITYLRCPTTAVYAYIIHENGRDYIFDEEKTKDLEWNSSVKNRIILMTLTYLGIELKDEVLLQVKRFGNDI
jgi:hypothetical protein